MTPSAFGTATANAAPSPGGYALAGQWGGNKTGQKARLEPGIRRLPSWPTKKRWSHSQPTPAPRRLLRGLRGPRGLSGPPAHELRDTDWSMSSSDDYYSLERDRPQKKTEESTALRNKRGANKAGSVGHASKQLLGLLWTQQLGGRGNQRRQKTNQKTGPGLSAHQDKN